MADAGRMQGRQESTHLHHGFRAEGPGLQAAVCIDDDSPGFDPLHPEQQRRGRLRGPDPGGISSGIDRRIEELDDGPRARVALLGAPLQQPLSCHDRADPRIVGIRQPADVGHELDAAEQHAIVVTQPYRSADPSTAHLHGAAPIGLISTEPRPNTRICA